MNTTTKTYGMYEYDELDGKMKAFVRGLLLNNGMRQQILKEHLMANIRACFPNSKLYVLLSFRSESLGVLIYGDAATKDILEILSGGKEIPNPTLAGFAGTITKKQKKTLSHYADEWFSHIEILSGGIDFLGDWNAILNNNGYRDIAFEDIRLLQDSVRKMFKKLCMQYSYNGCEYLYKAGDDEVSAFAAANGLKFLIPA